MDKVSVEINYSQPSGTVTILPDCCFADYAAPLDLLKDKIFVGLKVRAVVISHSMGVASFHIKVGRNEYKGTMKQNHPKWIE